MDLLMDNIVNYSKKLNLNVYYSTDVDIVISFEWDKRMGTWKDFLNNSRLNGTKSIILSIKKFEDEDVDVEASSSKKFFNKIAEIDIMYIMNDIGYKYHEEAGWYNEINSYNFDDLFDEMEDKKILSLNKEVNEKSIETLSQEMIKFLDEETSGFQHSNIDEYIKSFWLYKGINLDFGTENEIKIKIDKVNKKVKKYIEMEDHKRERERLYKIIPDFISVIAKKPQHSITLEDLKSYLSQNNVKVKYKSNINSLYNQILKKIKLKNDK